MKLFFASFLASAFFLRAFFLAFLVASFTVLYACLLTGFRAVGRIAVFAAAFAFGAFAFAGFVVGQAFAFFTGLAARFFHIAGGFVMRAGGRYGLRAFTFRGTFLRVAFATYQGKKRESAQKQ